VEDARHELNFDQREIVLRANFDEADEQHCVWTSVRFIMSGPRHPRVGEAVFLMDSDGSGRVGWVEELNGWMARVRLDRPDSPPA
jgi:hypothetical protein